MRLELMRKLWSDQDEGEKKAWVNKNRRLRRTPVLDQEEQPYENVFTRDRTEVTVRTGISG